jgi:hypothetical protein
MKLKELQIDLGDEVRHPKNGKTGCVIEFLIQTGPDSFKPATWRTAQANENGVVALNLPGGEKGDIWPVRGLTKVVHDEV